MTLEDALLEVVHSTPLPLKTAEITRGAKPLAGKLATPKAVTAALAALADAGALRRIAAGTAARPEPLHTTLSDEAASAALLHHLVRSAKKEQQASKLKGKLPASLHAHFESALAGLVKQGNVFVLPGPKRLVYAEKPSPSAFLSATHRKALQKILDQANGVRATPATLAGFIAWLDGGPAAPQGALPPAAPPLPKPLPPLDAALLQEWYTLDRARSSTVMIPIPQTYARYDAWAQAQGGVADSQDLRNFMQGLYNNGLVLLEPCERPQDLPPHERAMLVPMSLGPPGWSWCWVG